MISAETYNSDYEKAVKFGYNKGIDEFAEKLKAELLLSKNIISEHRRICESGSHMEDIYSSSIGTLNGVYSMVDEVAEQLKEE